MALFLIPELSNAGDMVVKKIDSNTVLITSGYPYLKKQFLKNDFVIEIEKIEGSEFSFKSETGFPMIINVNILGQTQKVAGNSVTGNGPMFAVPLATADSSKKSTSDFMPIDSVGGTWVFKNDNLFFKVGKYLLKAKKSGAKMVFKQEGVIFENFLITKQK